MYMSEQFNLNNRYQFMGLIGKGRLGDVYRAADNFFRRDVALKMLRKETCTPEFLQYFSSRYTQQISMLAKLNQPSIIKVFPPGQWTFIQAPAIFNTQGNKCRWNKPQIC